MRIYELAKESGVTSVEVLKAAEEAGMEATSAISSVDDGEAETLRSALSNVAKRDLAAERASKRNLAAAATEDVLSFPAMIGLAKAWEKTDSTPAGRQRTLDSYKAACALKPSSVSTLLKTGDLAVRMGQHATAVEVYSRAVAANPADISAIDGLIRALRKTGKGKIADAYQTYRATIPVRKAK